jgi:4-hydroxy-tetrahydrodipicolinate synthase
MYWAFNRGQISQTQRFATAFMKLTSALFIESNPVPVKYALSLLNVMSPQVRLPLAELNNRTKADIAFVLAHVRERYADYLIGNPTAAEPSLNESIRAAAD